MVDLTPLKLRAALGLDAGLKACLMTFLFEEAAFKAFGLLPFGLPPFLG